MMPLHTKRLWSTQTSHSLLWGTMSVWMPHLLLTGLQNVGQTHPTHTLAEWWDLLWRQFTQNWKCTFSIRIHFFGRKQKMFWRMSQLFLFKTKVSKTISKCLVCSTEETKFWNDMKVSKRSQNFHFGWTILLRQDTTDKKTLFFSFSCQFWHFGTFCFYNMSSFRVAERKHPNNFNAFYLFASIDFHYNTYFKGNLLKMNTY